jgi:putative membrane protein
VIWAKALHMAAIAIWTAGLLVLPGLYLRRADVPSGPPLHRLQRMTRFLYVAILSPAAFVAVGSGIALIFLTQVFEPWLGLKLALVGGLVALHVMTGLVILKIFEDGRSYPRWRFLAVTTLTGALSLAVLTVVLAKPDLPDLASAALFKPGALPGLVAPINPFH